MSQLQTLDWELLPRMRPGGVMLFDNMLWSGRVLDPKDDEDRAIDELNTMIASDDRVENVLLTVRDGVQFVIKKKSVGYDTAVNFRIGQ